MNEQHRDAGDGDQREPDEPAGRPLPEERPAEQAAGNDQQREHRRDDARGDVALGEIDDVEVDAELGEAEERRRDGQVPAQFQALAPPGGEGRHRRGGDDEAIGDRPLRRDRAELVADDDPGRPPDAGEDDERDDDRKVGPPVGHRALIAAASRSTVFGLLVPAGDEADLARPPVVEVEALRAEARGFVRAGLEEDLVGLDRIDQALGRGLGKRLRRGIGRAGILEPQPVLEQREDLRGEHPALGQQMAGAFAADLDLIGKVGPEQDQRLGVEPAVLDESERQRVDAGPPGDVGRAFAGGRQRVGEARAVHVEREPALLRQLAKRRDLRGAVNQAIFGGVGDRDRRGLDLVDVGADRGRTPRRPCRA